MRPLKSIFAGVARLFGIPSAEQAERLPEQQRSALAANFGAIVVNGLFFPAAGKILGAGLLLAYSAVTRAGGCPSNDRNRF